MSESATLFSIASGEPFIDQLVGTLVDPSLRAQIFGEGPLHDFTLLLPTHRAVETVSRALLEQSGGALLMPRLHALGAPEALGVDVLTADQSYIAEAIGEHERHFYLAALIDRWMVERGHAQSPALSASLAHGLTQFLDEAQGDHVDWEGLRDLVPDDLAKNWQETLAFLAIITEHWPDYLIAEGRLDPVDRRDRLLEGLAELWRQHPPSGPVLAAGSTGSQPATARLLSVIAHLPRGAVILPGLDLLSSDALFEQMQNEDSHPQTAMAQLLASMQVDRRQVRAWPHPQQMQRRAEIVEREKLLHIAMMPASETGDWQNLRTKINFDAALAGVHYLEAPEPRAEAGAIALIVREAIETADKTAALVTPDRNLARRVATELRRWGIRVDDTAGQALRQTQAAKVILLMVQAVTRSFEPVALLALLKHPWIFDDDPAIHQQLLALEAECLRGPRRYDGLSELRHLISARSKSDDLEKGMTHIIDRLEDALAPLIAMRQAPIGCSLFLDRIEQACHAACGSPDKLSRDDAGRHILTLFAQVRAQSGFEPERMLEDWVELLTQWLDQASYHASAVTTHPRIAIWGQLEARLMKADLVILGGLNEGSWPPATETGPWLSRPMRDRLGMRAPERRIGLAAHDFVQNACAGEVVLSRSLKIDGVPTLAARWIRRLHALSSDLPQQSVQKYLDWWRAIDQFPAEKGELPRGPAARPAPRPPKAARPRQLSVTQIETLITDPYQIYARHILRLRDWEAVNAPITAAHRGQLVHRVLEIFTSRFPDHLPDNSAEEMMKIADEIGPHYGVSSFWQPRLRAIWQWAAEFEQKARRDVVEMMTEKNGLLKRVIDDVPVTLTARADRLDRLRDGTVRIIDYKTGALPSTQDVENYYALQLPLEAAMLQEGGFEGLPHHTVSALTYLRLHGGLPAGEQRDDACDVDHIHGAVEAMEKIWAYYLDPDHPFLPRIRPNSRNYISAYDHLSRIDEWGVAEDGGEGA